MSDRTVAIKVQPVQLASDADRVPCFRREPKALAVLDHPNILTVSSVEEAGLSGEPRHAV